MSHVAVLIACAVTAMIPVETAGRKLDDDDWDSATVAPEGGGMGVTFDALPSGAHQ